MELNNYQNNINNTVVVCGGGLVSKIYQFKIVLMNKIKLKVGCLATCYLARRNFNCELYEYRAGILLILKDYH